LSPGVGSVYREKCHALLANRLATNIDVRSLTILKFTEEGEYLDSNKYDGAGGWNEIFEKINASDSSQEVIEFLFKIEKLCREGYSRRSAIRTVINILNKKQDLAEKNDSVLIEYLKDDNHTYFILEAIIELKRISPNMLNTVTRMAGDAQFRLHRKAQETLDKWRSIGETVFI